MRDLRWWMKTMDANDEKLKFIHLQEEGTLEGSDSLRDPVRNRTLIRQWIMAERGNGESWRQ